MWTLERKGEAMARKNCNAKSESSESEYGHVMKPKSAKKGGRKKTKKGK
jgi:hypothetical protein